MFQVCPSNHVAYHWCSQPVLRRLHAGDLMTSAAILTSGNNYAKVAMFAKFLKLHFPCSSTFHRIQNSYLLTAIEDLWTTEQAKIAAEMKGKSVVLLCMIFYFTSKFMKFKFEVNYYNISENYFLK